MNGIQLVLLTGTVFIGLYFLIRLKKRLLDIILLFALIACAIVFILWPDVTTSIAKKLGVGRGADLIFYVSILIFWFVSLKLYARIRKLEQQFTKIVREDALKKVQDTNEQVH
jgi:small membrane protein